MDKHRAPSAHSRSTIAQLAEPLRMQLVGPVAARFLYSLRLIALHDRARLDPLPELATRLGSVETAAKAFALSQVISATWPENIHLSRYCCDLLSHDEATIGALVDAVCQRNRPAFEAAIEGLIRPDRTERLWDAILALVVTEHRCG